MSQLLACVVKVPLPPRVQGQDRLHGDLGRNTV